MAAINREWHESHRMPQRPTREQRAQWHYEHQQACGCRTPSEAEAQLIAEHEAALREPA